MQCRVCGRELTEENWAPSRRQGNRKICRACDAAHSVTYYAAHTDERKQAMAIYDRANYDPDRESERHKAYYLTNTEKEAARKRAYANTPAGKIAQAKINANRRTFGRIETILGEPFPGGELHHMTANVGVYIPHALHRSIYHILLTGYNMDKINAAALEFHNSKTRKE